MMRSLDESTQWHLVLTDSTFSIKRLSLFVRRDSSSKGPNLSRSDQTPNFETCDDILIQLTLFSRVGLKVVAF